MRNEKNCQNILIAILLLREKGRFGYGPMIGAL